MCIRDSRQAALATVAALEQRYGALCRPLLVNPLDEPGRCYRCPLPSGRTIDLCFYDGPLARAVAFEKLLADGGGFARRLVASGSDAAPLCHIATDGETYGHHHRYAELAIWREASADPAYQPVAALADEPDFADYTGYEARWQRELEQMERMAAQPDEGRFYYSGMAIGVLLDRLQPGWKARALEPGVTLEGVLGESLSQRAE